jgi:hypothetical protein
MTRGRSRGKPTPEAARPPPAPVARRSHGSGRGIVPAPPLRPIRRPSPRRRSVRSSTRPSYAIRRPAARRSVLRARVGGPRARARGRTVFHPWAPPFERGSRRRGRERADGPCSTEGAPSSAVRGAEGASARTDRVPPRSPDPRARSDAPSARGLDPVGIDVFSRPPSAIRHAERTRATDRASKRAFDARARLSGVTTSGSLQTSAPGARRRYGRAPVLRCGDPAGRSTPIGPPSGSRRRTTYGWPVSPSSGRPGGFGSFPVRDAAWAQSCTPTDLYDARARLPSATAPGAPPIGRRIGTANDRPVAPATRATSRPRPARGWGSGPTLGRTPTRCMANGTLLCSVTAPPTRSCRVASNDRPVSPAARTRRRSRRLRRRVAARANGRAPCSRFETSPDLASTIGGSIDSCAGTSTEPPLAAGAAELEGPIRTGSRHYARTRSDADPAPRRRGRPCGSDRPTGRKPPRRSERSAGRARRRDNR